MTRDRQRFDPIDLEALKAGHQLSALFEQHGFKVRGPRGGSGFSVCPWHPEKTGSCHVDDRKGRFHCFGCGVTGDHIDAVMHFRGLSFVQAVEELGGVRPVSADDRRVFEERRREAEEADRAARARKVSNAERLFAAGKPIAGTHAAEYLAGRGLKVTKAWTFDLRFEPELPYHGFADRDASELTKLGVYPAMLAAIRSADGRLIGTHRTYLDPEQPAKLIPPGDRTRNKAKKIVGEMTGGLIRLSPIGPRLAIGEGIETTRAWFALGLGGGGDVAIAAGVSLGNMAGKALSSRRHPQDEKRRIPWGGPDLDAPGMVLPEDVREVVLIGDGDSNPAMTRAALLVAGQRFEEQGRTVSVAMAPDRYDFADVLAADDQDVPAIPPAKSLPVFLADSTPIFDPPFVSRFGATWLHEITGRKPVRNWLVKDLLLAGTFGIVFGPPGCGKSFLMADACLTLATAKGDDRPEWFGYRGRRTGVIYVVAEGGDDFTIRMHAWRQAHDIAGDALVPFVFMPTSIDLRSNDAEAKRLAEEVNTLSAIMLDRCGVKAELVVIDTVARALAGGNENASEVMGAFVINCGLVQQLTGAAVIGVHHGGKEAGRGPRGHEALHGAADLEIEVAGPADGEPNKWTIRKFKAGPAGAAHPFRLRPMTVGVDDDEDPIMSCVVVSKVGEGSGTTGKVKGFKANATEMAFLRVLRQAVEAEGVMAPPGVRHGPNVELVVHDEHLRRMYRERRKEVSLDDGKALDQAVRQSWKRAVEKLTDFSIIGRSGDYWFFTGKPIIGLRPAGVTLITQDDDDDPRAPPDRDIRSASRDVTADGFIAELGDGEWK